MKKNVKKIMVGLLTAALLAGISSCSSSTGGDSLAETSGDVFSGEELVFTAVSDSVSAQDVNLILKYDRTVVGAKEQISLVDVDLDVSYNGERIPVAETLTFELDEYSSLEEGYAGGAERRSAYQKEYKIKIPLNKKISVGGVLKVQLKEAKVSGEGAEAVDLGGIVVAVIDSSEAAGWYKELSANEYIPLISKMNGKNLNDEEGSAE